MFTEEELLPLSGLQHMAFCERRWALVQIEGIWEENRFTAEGEILHAKVHSGEMEARPGVVIRRTVPLHSFRLGLTGQADLVEFQPAKTGEGGVSLQGKRGWWRPYPIEYKRSRDKAGSQAYRIQLCAQALCLEEMLSIEVQEGAVFDGAARRRLAIPFDAALRRAVEEVAARMHDLFRKGDTPAPVYTKACRSCSLVERCLPETFAAGRSLNGYYDRMLAEAGR